MKWTADRDSKEADMAAFDVSVPTGYTSPTAAVGALGYLFGSEHGDQAVGVINEINN
ncbi:hypothetical protein ACFQ7N_16895 [Streptomyces niveus]|uniref:hypothetical protein n=1 Tax=Streptomyces niveus TaxID=193462 RepID=UPI00368E460B